MTKPSPPLDLTLLMKGFRHMISPSMDKDKPPVAALHHATVLAYVGFRLHDHGHDDVDLVGSLSYFFPFHMGHHAARTRDAYAGTAFALQHCGVMVNLDGVCSIPELILKSTEEARSKQHKRVEDARQHPETVWVPADEIAAKRIVRRWVSSDDAFFIASGLITANYVNKINRFVDRLCLMQAVRDSDRPRPRSRM